MASLTKRVSRLICLCLLGLLAISLSCSQNQESDETEWISLFNGKDLQGWTPKFTNYELGENVNNTFRVQDEVLRVSYDEWENFDRTFGHLFYKDKYSHYKIRLEYRFLGEQVAGGPNWAFRNSGIMIHCQDPKTMRVEQEFPVCIEVQLLGGNGEDERSTGNLCTPGTNVVLGGELELQHCINSSSETYHGDQWVTAEVEVHGSGTITHYINGDMVMQYEQPQLDEHDDDAQRLLKEGDKLVSEGYISLQAESHPVEFRNIELLVLEE